MKSLVALSLAFFVAVAIGDYCARPPSQTKVCGFDAATMRTPSSYANRDADNQLFTQMMFLASSGRLPSQACVDAYLAFMCSEAYPFCQRVIGTPLPTCRVVCDEYVLACHHQLPGVEKPHCSNFTLSTQCSRRERSQRFGGLF